jgi:hypothetical protein
VLWYTILSSVNLLEASRSLSQTWDMDTNRGPQNDYHNGVWASHYLRDRPSNGIPGQAFPYNILYQRRDTTLETRLTSSPVVERWGILVSNPNPGHLHHGRSVSLRLLSCLLFLSSFLNFPVEAIVFRHPRRLQVHHREALVAGWTKKFSSC